MSSDRDRLIELVDKAKEEYANDITDHTETDYIVETLLNEGAILPPCKVGETVWVISQWYKYTKPEIESRKVLSVQIYKNGDIQYHYKDGCFWQGHIGKTVFLTKEEAEAKLKELGK